VGPRLSQPKGRLNDGHDPGLLHGRIVIRGPGRHMDMGIKASHRHSLCMIRRRA
jgi:hypothetical protein